ncbi:MAG: alkene reductase [Burkholderiaceae bacterium]|nr:alkene reductase [Microbacteriaceae bacterium]
MQLFTPLHLGALPLRNRVVMAPLTRVRSGADGVPNDLVVEYYGQRASTGMITSEGAYTSAGSQAYPGQPGIVTEEQIAGWRRVTDAVHARGGLIVMQLMHGGRVTHPSVNGGNPVIAPSAIAIEGEVRTADGKAPYPVPVAADAASIIAEHVTAARNAIAAGMDGVEIHSANGYLLHEFLAPSSNLRDDEFGGTPQKRARLGIEVATAVAAAIGADRVGIRISPSHNIQDVLEIDAADTRLTYETLLSGLAPLGLAYLSVLHSDPAGEFVQDLRAHFGGPLVANSGFGVITSREDAAALIEHGKADAVAVGRMLIANPDLVRRWAEERELNEPDASTFYGPDAHGYTDYPALAS